MKRMNEAAVSPVVGVMLMLVMTIILAAVVSAFAGGLSSDQSKAPQATLGVTSAVKYIQDSVKTNYEPDGGYTADNGLLFEHKGGDSFALNDIEIQIQTQDVKTTIGLDDALPTTRGTTSAVTAYLMKVGDSGTFINPGDKFMLYADNFYDSSEAAYAPQGKALTWQPVGAAGGFAAFLNTKCEYKVIDKKSGKAIQSGEFVLH